MISAENMVRNPRAGVDLVFGSSSWTGSNATLTRDTAVFRTSPASFKLGNSSAITAALLSPTAAASAMPVVPGSYYTLSAYARNAGTGRNSRIDILWYQSDGTTLISTSTGVNFTPAANVFTRGWTTALAPAIAAFGRARIYSIVSGGVVADDSYVADVQFEKGSVASPYLDGTTPSSYWTGTAHNSSSKRRMDDYDAAPATDWSITMSVGSMASWSTQPTTVIVAPERAYARY